MAMKLTGHETEEVYRRDAIVSEADLREGVRKATATRLRDINGVGPHRQIKWGG